MLFEYKIIIFLIISVGFVYITGSTLRNYRHHGFYRFFTWESVLVLVLINLDFWFKDPFSIFQVLSWILLIISLFMVIFGVLFLYRQGKPDRKRKDPGLIGIERTTQLATTGLYQYIRHPIYSSILYGAWGVYFKHLTWISFSLVIMTIVFLTITAKMEEAENIRYFGDEYLNYMKKTKMFIPFLF